LDVDTFMNIIALGNAQSIIRFVYKIYVNLITQPILEYTCIAIKSLCLRRSYLFGPLRLTSDKNLVQNYKNTQNGYGASVNKKSFSARSCWVNICYSNICLKRPYQFSFTDVTVIYANYYGTICQPDYLFGFD
jgi:hypothetical protein